MVPTRQQRELHPDVAPRLAHDGARIGLRTERWWEVDARGVDHPKMDVGSMQQPGTGTTSSEFFPVQDNVLSQERCGRICTWLGGSVE